MKTDTKSIFAILVLALAVVAVVYFVFGIGKSSIANQIEGSPQAGKDLSTLCNRNSDCVLVQKSCCLCSGLKAINKNYASEWKNKTMRLCGVVHPCSLEYCKLPTSSACLQGKCTAFLGNSVFKEEAS